MYTAIPNERALWTVGSILQSIGIRERAQAAEMCLDRFPFSSNFCRKSLSVQACPVFFPICITQKWKTLYVRQNPRFSKGGKGYAAGTLRPLQAAAMSSGVYAISLIPQCRTYSQKKPKRRKSTGRNRMHGSAGASVFPVLLMSEYPKHNRLVSVRQLWQH